MVIKYLAVLALIILGWLLLKKLLRKGNSQPDILPLCHNCETNRNVVPNDDTHSKYPKKMFTWYCTRCEEGF